MKRALEKIEKAVIRIGAVLGVVSMVILLHSEILKPSPPNIDVLFMLSNSDEINYAQQMSDPKEIQTEAFPLGLVLFNNGGTVAKGVILSLIANQGVSFTFKGLEVETRHILEDKARAGALYRIRLGNVNPGEKVFLDENIWCQSFNMARVGGFRAVLKDGQEKDMPLTSLMVIHDFEVRLSGENTGMKTRYLYLTTGFEARFRERKEPYYTFREEAVTFYKGDSRPND
jgi:hypothetical protein